MKKLLHSAPVLLVIVMLWGCKGSTHNNEPSLTPEAGTGYKTGNLITLKTHYAPGLKSDSIVYLLDSVKVGLKKDSAALIVKTDTMSLGPRIFTAKIYSGGKNTDVSTNIMLLPAKAPEQYTFKVEKVYPHDTSAFTEGLVFYNGALYESAGGYSDPPPGQPKEQQSSLRKVDLATGKVLQKVLIDPKVFAEGIAIVDDKIIQLTYHEKVGFVYDLRSFKQLSSFPNNSAVEGWGLCFDGNKLYMDDSTNRIWFLNKNTYQQQGFIDVYDDKGPVNEINELEYIDNKLYANIWKTNTIIAIDPKTGAVLQKVDLTNLYPENGRNANADVLNGIAYDAAAKRIFITGKKWPHLYQVSFIKK